MKPINLFTLIQSKESLEPDVFNKLLKYHSIDIALEEIDDLKVLVDELTNQNPSASLFDGYHVGFKIPQISKEFDLLRFGENYKINIEMKQKSNEVNILKQLNRNSYYLDFLKQSYNFCFISSTKKLYRINLNGGLEVQHISVLIGLLEGQIAEKELDIDKAFNPSNYLVSPFNSTDKFVSGNYFLTGHQEQIKNQALTKINSSSSAFISIVGKAGTGKSLLAYDIAKSYISKGDEVCILHCGMLNEGHNLLKAKYKWKVLPIKSWQSNEICDSKLIVIDEAQRISTFQIEGIIDRIKKNNSNCIFSYDLQQWLKKGESRNNLESTIESRCNALRFELTDKIRTNKEIATFIRCLFDSSREIENIKRDNVEISYFKSAYYVVEYLEDLYESGWEVINFTADKHKTFPYEKYKLISSNNAHEVIGQEFDNVVAIIDSYFYYENNKLSNQGYSRKPFYHPTKMLFQIVTRTRKKLKLVIIGNQEILNRCLEILTAP